MSDEQHTSHLQSRWTGNSDGDGVIRFDWNGTLDYGIPVSTGGKPGRSNPEEMLLGAVASCFSITLALLIEKKRYPAVSLAVEASGTMVRQPDRTLKLTEIVLCPRLAAAELNEEQRNSVLDLAHKADKYCVVSKALRGNVEIVIKPELVLEERDG